MAKSTVETITEPKSAVVVLSGGQDSATCLALACEKHGADKVAAITFNYSQRHASEVEYAKKLVKHFEVKPHKIVKMDFYPTLTSNALFDKSAKIETESGSKHPNTYVEGRNALFLLTAGIWAKSLGAKKIYTGVSQIDFSNYPDCRESFIRAQEKSMRLAMDWPFEIITPFMRMSKKDEWALADKLGILELIKNSTVTCYEGIPGKGCGKCPACIIRNNGLKAYEGK